MFSSIFFRHASKVLKIAGNFKKNCILNFREVSNHIEHSQKEIILKFFVGSFLISIRKSLDKRCDMIFSTRV